MLCFLHIPKTGGSTLRWIIDRSCPRFHYEVRPWFREGSQLPLEAVAHRPRVDAVGAHRPLAPGAWPDGPVIAMVRDPVRRVLSHVRHLRAEPGVWAPEPPAELDLPLADWIERRPLALFDNGQVRYLSGAAQFDVMPVTRAMDESDLARAVEAVRTRVTAAPMEAFDEALLLWARQLGWRPPFYRRINVRGGGAATGASDRDRRAVEAWNRLDAALCEEIDALFRERVRVYEADGGCLPQDVEAFRARNATAAVQLRLLAHTSRRGLRHPVRAARSLVRQVRSRHS